MRIEIDNLERQQVRALLEEHLQDMYASYIATRERACVRCKQVEAAFNHVLDGLGW